MTWDTWMHGNGSWMALWMILFWGAVVALLALLIRDVRPRAGSWAAQARAMLAERYARGEIDTEEFRARSREIDGMTR